MSREIAKGILFSALLTGAILMPDSNRNAEPVSTIYTEAKPVVAGPEITKPRFPTPEDRRILLPIGDVSQDSRETQAWLQNWYDAVTSEGASVQMFDTYKSIFESTSGSIVRYTPVKDSTEPNKIPNGLLLARQKQHYQFRIHVTYPDDPYTDVWLPVFFDSQKRVATFDDEKGVTINGVVAMEFDGQVLARDINPTLAPSDLREVPWTKP